MGDTEYKHLWSVNVGAGTCGAYLYLYTLVGVVVCRADVIGHDAKRSHEDKNNLDNQLKIIIKSSLLFQRGVCSKRRTYMIEVL